MINLSAFDNPAFALKSINIDDALNYPIRAIVIEPVLIAGENKWIMSDSERPVVYGDCFFMANFVGINGEYYQKHQDVLDEKIEQLITQLKTDYLEIDGSLLTERNIRAICSNPSIKTLRITDYTLNRKDYE